MHVGDIKILKSDLYYFKIYFGFIYKFPSFYIIIEDQFVSVSVDRWMCVADMLVVHHQADHVELDQ